jgi:MFS family permease
VTVESYEQLLRWYPPQWRKRYGDEMTALLEDTYSAASAVPPRQRVGLLRSGLAERARANGFVGSSQEPAVRVRGGALLVLCGWAFFIVASAMFVKVADRSSISSTGHSVAAGVFNLVAVAAFIGCLFVGVAAAVVLPAFVRLLRAGRWPEVRRPVVIAVASAAASAVLFVVLIAWAHDLSAHARNGGLPVYGWFFVLVGLVFFAAVASGTAAAVRVALRVELSPRQVRALGSLAVGLVGVMALLLGSLVAWWVAEAQRAPGFLLQSIGNGVPYTSRVVPPVLLASGILMTLGLALGLVGLVRVIGSLGQGRPASA